MLELVLSLLLLFGQVQNQEFLDLQLLLGLSDFGIGHGGFPGHGLSDSSGVFDFFVDIADNFFEFCESVFHFSDFDLNFFLFSFICGRF